MNTAQKEIEEFGDEFLNHLKEREAWSKLSDDEDFNWTMERIEKYADKIDWSKLSENRKIKWELDIIQKYKDRIEWEEFSHSFFDSSNRFQYSENCRAYPNDIAAYLEKFSKEWDWSQVSRRIEEIDTDLIEQFLYKWDWKELIDNASVQWTPQKFNKYKKYIPISNIQNFTNSNLWNQLVDYEYERLEAKVILDS